MNQQKHFINAGPHGAMCEIGQCGGNRKNKGYIYVPHFGPRTKEYVVILEQRIATIETLNSLYAQYDNSGLAGDDDVWQSFDANAIIHWNDAWCEELDCLWSETPIIEFDDGSIIFTMVRGRFDEFPNELLWVVGMPNYAWVVSSEVANTTFLDKVPPDLLYNLNFWRKVSWVSAGGYDFNEKETLQWWAHSQGERLFSDIRSNYVTITTKPKARQYLAQIIKEREYDALPWYRKLF